MFGNKQRSNSDTTWAFFNSKHGCFQIGSKSSGTLQEFNQLENVHVRRVMITENPNYEDRTKMDKQIAISVRSTDGKDAVVKFAMGQFAVKVLGLLNAADLSKPISLSSGVFEAGTTDKNLKSGDEKIREADQPYLVGYQNEQKLQAKYSDDPNFQIPKVDYIKVNHPVTGAPLDDVRDPTARDAYILDFALVLQEKVSSASKAHPAPKPAAPAPDSSDVEPSLSPSDLDDGGAADEAHFRSDAPAVS